MPSKKNLPILNTISQKIQEGKAKLVKELVQQALDEEIPAQQILENGLLCGMYAIGEKFKNNEIFVPEVLLSARAMNMGTAALKSALIPQSMPSIGKACIGTVKGDQHDIGKNLVRMMLESRGIETIDLGTDVSAETFVETAKRENCQIISCSALLTTTMQVMQDVVTLSQEMGIREKVCIMVGGAPVTQSFCDRIGADVYTSDAASAAKAAEAYCRRQSERARRAIQA